MSDEKLMTQEKKMNVTPPARLHAILARRGSYAVVFRRGPSDKVAVIGWDRRNDVFTLGQWFRGRIYPLRSDLSPKGEYLIYFAAKYGRVNPVEKIIREELDKKQLGDILQWEEAHPEFRHDFMAEVEAYHHEREQEEKMIRKARAQEFERLKQSPDYHDYSWTAISRAPYLKALSLWWHGTGWNGGGLFVSEKEFYLNRPPEWVAKTVPGVQDHRLKELPPVEMLEWGVHGECMMVYSNRLIRDGWKYLEDGWKYLEDTETAWYGIYEKTLPNGWILRKIFPGGYEHLHEVYWERHLLLDTDGKTLMDGGGWRWAEFDNYRKRIVYAENGAIYELKLKLPLQPVMLHDFNGMTFQRISAPY